MSNLLEVHNLQTHFPTRPGLVKAVDGVSFTIGEGELLVRVKAALTDGTDLKVFLRGYHSKMIVPPALFGHELAGTVEQLGAGIVVGG